MATGNLTESASQWLKRITREEHVMTEQTDLALKLANASISLGEYAKLLRVYACLHARIEEEAGYLGLDELLSGPRKSQLAQEDIAALGDPAEASQALSHALRAHRECLVPQTPSWLLGRIYVMEGSALGAAVLRPRVARALSLRDGLRYFEGRGASTMPHWQWFRAELDRRLQDVEARVQAQAGATFQFQAVRVLFSAVLERDRRPAGARSLTGVSLSA